MKSWMSTRLPACAPPPKIWICGIGTRVASAPPIDSYKGMRRDVATACAAASETASVAFAPRRDLLGVPSRSIRRRSSAVWSSAAMPRNALAISPSTLATARCTSRPPNAAPPSRSSIASRVPFDAPAGQIARPNAPSSSVTSASTVGRPRLSQTRRACTVRIARRTLIARAPRAMRSRSFADDRGARRESAARHAAPRRARRRRANTRPATCRRRAQASGRAAMGGALLERGRRLPSTRRR